MTPRDIPAAKACIRGASIAALRARGTRALDRDAAEAVRALGVVR